MRILSLQPHYQMTKLYSLIELAIIEQALKHVCSCERSNCHNANNESIETKVEKLNHFLAAKYQGQYHLFFIKTQLFPHFRPLVELAKEIW